MKVPKKYQSPGLYVFCNYCKRTVSNDQCPVDIKVNCSHVYQSRIWNPHTQRTNIIKTWGAIPAKEAFSKHLSFRKELEDNKYYYNPPAQQSRPTITTLTAAKNKYLDYLADVGVPEHEKRNRTDAYIKSQRKYIDRFIKVLKSNGLNPSNAHPQISSDSAGWFHAWLESMKYANKTYNHHITSVKMMFDWLEKKEAVKFNPFENLKTKPTFTDPEIILEEELSQLFKVITRENGFKKVGKEVKNYHRDWISTGIKLALYTGERRDGIVLLKNKHIEGNYIKIPNWKRNRHQGVEDFSYVPITSDISDFLANIQTEDPEAYLLVPSMKNRNTVKEQLSKSFAHYWEVAGIKKEASFKNLRKTFETRMFILLGDKVKGLKRHKSMTVKVDHYLSQKAITEELVSKRMFDF